MSGQLEVDAAGIKRQRLDWTSHRYAGGRHVVHDPASKAYRADTSGVKLRRVVHALRAPVLDQLKVGSCTGNSGAQCLNSDPLHRPRERRYTEADAVAFYSDATRLDDWTGTYPPDDTGSSGLAVGKALVARGLITRYEWGFGIDDALKLATTDVLSVGTEWTDGMFDPDPDGFVSPTGSVAGGHQWTIRGIDPREEWVLILNSWGAGWGGWTQGLRRVYGGHARMRFADLEALLARNGDVVRYVR